MPMLLKEESFDPAPHSCNDPSLPLRGGEMGESSNTIVKDHAAAGEFGSFLPPEGFSQVVLGLRGGGSGEQWGALQIAGRAPHGWK